MLQTVKCLTMWTRLQMQSNRQNLQVNKNNYVLNGIIKTVAYIYHIHQNMIAV